MKIRRRSSSYLLLLSLGLPLLAQSSPPPGPQTPAADTPAAPEAVYKTTARSVVVDVVVTDITGHPVKGLKGGQFHVKENGEPQTVTFFEPHVGVESRPPASAPAPLPPGEYSDLPMSSVTDSVNVLLLDSLNTPLQDQTQVRQAMVKYLRTAAPGTRIAVFTLASRLRFVQGFTSDSAVLLAAIDGKNKKAIPQTSVLLQSTEENEQQDRLTDLMSQDPSAAGAVASLQQFQADEAAFRTDLRVQITLDALKQIGRYLAGIPGRKNLIWFSGAFPVNLFPDAGGQSPFEATRTYSEDIHQATDLLSIGQVAVYPVDARGLMVAPMYDASISGSRYGRNPQSFGNDNAKFILQTESEHSTMDELARATGGQAIYNTNGLKDALARVLLNGSNYYTLAYTPTNKSLDGKLRKIDIKLDEKGYKLSFRRSYFADDLNGRHAATAPAADNAFVTAMAPGLPTASQILFKLRALPLGPQPTAASAPKAADGPATPEGGLLGDAPRFKGPAVRYGLDYAASVRDLRLSVTPDGLHHGVITVSIVAYDNDANVLNSLTRTIRLALRPETYTQMLQTGMQGHAEIDLPRGPVHLRTGIYDVASGTMGILDVPLAAQKNPNPNPSAAAKQISDPTVAPNQERK